MKAASSPMAAVEALHLDVAYIAVAKSLDLPCQSYMALSDAKILDAQAGAETFASAMLAGLAGVNSVSGPGMLDFLLVFSLPKLFFDDEVAGQVQHFLREIRILDDLPTGPLVDQLMVDQHLIMADHTMANWPTELYLTGPTIDRENRENWLRAGGKDTYARACEEVDRRLAAYQPVMTDPLVEAELQAIIRSGLIDQAELPELPVAIAPTTSIDAGPAQRRNPRRERAGNVLTRDFATHRPAGRAARVRLQSYAAPPRDLEGPPDVLRILLFRLFSGRLFPLLVATTSCTASSATLRAASCRRAR
jgi:trimethylamine--corrinoid protein Co-methyltransferase